MCLRRIFLRLQVKTILDEILEKMSDEFNMMELFAKVEEKTPYVLVALQECERMNTLTREMKRSLKEVDLGLKVCALCPVEALTVSSGITSSEVATSLTSFPHMYSYTPLYIKGKPTPPLAMDNAIKTPILLNTLDCKTKQQEQTTMNVAQQKLTSVCLDHREYLTEGG